MIIKELIEKLKQHPEDAMVYIEADHSQTPEQANRVVITGSEELNYYGDDCCWDTVEDWESDGEDLTKVTAVCIS